MNTARLEALTIAVVGGDEREQEIARLAAAAGAHVRAYGFPWPSKGIPGVDLAACAGAALDGADYALFPIPGLGSDGTLFAPHADGPILPDAALLGRLRSGAAIILGSADDALRQCAGDLGHRIVEYESDTELMLLRGPAIVEGALRVAIENTMITIHAASVGVVGYGNIGRLLARTLVLLGAHVSVFARSAVQRADAYAIGCSPRPLDELSFLAAGLEMLFSTVPAPVVDRTVLLGLPAGALVMDLAAPPGGVDRTAAAELNVRTVWARGLGRRAPVTVGRSQWRGIESRIAEIEQGALG